MMPFVARRRLWRSLGFLLVSSATCSWSEAAEQRIDFQRDVRPILSSYCFQFHGPDEEHREAELRLDTRQGISGKQSGIIPGDPRGSELLLRVSSDDPDEQMPPPDTGKRLTDKQVDVLRQWIEQGASWSNHWAFEPPRRPPLPRLQRFSGWSDGPVDAFIAARWEQEQLAPSPPADAAALLRRVYLDVIGLPPSIEEANSFLRDERPDRYRTLINRLLQSPHHGEKWARHWLDAARYADSDGFEKDKPRRVWMYRDWVVQALNRDLPYDQFIVEQIAGDLLPHATQAQKVATGFLRNSMLNEEGGIDPEQFRMEAMFDRMDAIGKAILGVTIRCGQCHNHKYDPLTQRDYYRMFAFLNDTHEASITVYPADELPQRERIVAQTRAIENELKQQTPDWPSQLSQWMQLVRGNQPDWRVLPIENANDNSQRYLPQADGSLLAQGYAPTRFDAQFTARLPSGGELPEARGLRLELLTDADLPAGGPGRSIEGLCALTEFWLEARPSGGSWKRVAIVSASADFSNARQQLGPKFGDSQGKRGFTGPVQYALDGDRNTAWGIDAGPGRRNTSRKAVFVVSDQEKLSAGMELRFHLEQKHGGWNSDDNQNMNLGRFRLSATSSREAVADPLPARVRAIVESAAALKELSQTDVDELFSYWRTRRPDWQPRQEQLERLWSQHPPGCTQLVLARREITRDTHVLRRGDFLKPAEKVTPGVPDFLHALPETPETSPTRLDFARWLADRDSPTTARAIVNRVWQAYFGAGLVVTSEDLGSQSATVSHPELLDWLAVGLMEHGWSLKWLHRQILLSASYRQSSRATPELLQRDPANRWLARGPRFRLDAEQVRDAALAASGLLCLKMGGPSVYPPAPEFLFRPPASYGPKSWDLDAGSDKYRRALYTFRFRSVPYPALAVFDAPPGDAACTRRSRSNTPLQALTTLNEPLFVECARALAEKTLREDPAEDTQRIEFAFRRCLTRTPLPKETEILRGFLLSARNKFSAEQAREQVERLAKLDSPHAPPQLEPKELAAWTAICRVILNLDETISKE